MRECSYEAMLDGIAPLFSVWSGLRPNLDGAAERGDRSALSSLMEADEVAFHRMDACLSLASNVFGVERDEVYLDVVRRACELPES